MFNYFCNNLFALLKSIIIILSTCHVYNNIPLLYSLHVYIQIAEPLLPYALSFVAGAMIYVVYVRGRRFDRPGLE